MRILGRMKLQTKVLLMQVGIVLLVAGLISLSTGWTGLSTLSCSPNGSPVL